MQQKILKKKKITIKENEALLRLSGGDARKLLNLLELIVESSSQNEVIITDQIVMDAVQQKLALYDKSGEQHYDIISAFIKSIRGSDPKAHPHYYCDLAGLAALFAGFELLSLTQEEQRRPGSWHWHILAERR